MQLRQAWQLDPALDFLNHGSFGATPTRVLTAQRRMQDELERDPIRYLAPERELEPKLDGVREEVAQLIGAHPEDVAFVRNATDGVNAVLRSFPLDTGDEVLVTDHGYNACINAAYEATQRRGATVGVVEIPFPLASSEEVVAAIEQAITPRTRLILVDHVTSPTGLVFPLREIVRIAHDHHVRVLVDGAHAPGMLTLDLREIDADYYTANHHKWLCAPKASGYLWVRRSLQAEVRPNVISHAANRARPHRSRFLAEFDWTGTFDPTPILAVPEALQFLCSHHRDGLRGWMADNRELALWTQSMLASTLGIAPPAPPDMIGSLVAVPLPAASDSTEADALDPIQKRLRSHHRIEVPVFPGPTPGSRLLRVSLQAYNDRDQISRLAAALATELHGLL